MSLSATLAHMTESVGSRALQQHASEVVRRAAAGETLVMNPLPADMSADLRSSGQCLPCT